MLRGPSGRRDTHLRLVRAGLLGVVGTGALALAGWMLVGGFGADEVAAVVSLLIGVAGLLVSLAARLNRTAPVVEPGVYADDLARTVRVQWREEAAARRLREPGVLPLGWATTRREVADPPDARGAGGAGGRVLRRRLDGRLSGDFTEATGQLAAGYDQLPDGRLVVIGEPGAGKSVLALLLTLGLLDERPPGGRVPVLLPVSTWDPVRERLDDWIVRSLAVPYYGGDPDIPRTLLTQGLLLPVLDGLDEIPESARRGAIRGINEGLGGDRPVVVTCRAVEYEELIKGGAPALRHAPVVEVLPVPPADVIAYLRGFDETAAERWDPVYDRLRAEPAGPLAQALSTPLMVTTARLVYRGPAQDPGELLDAVRFDCRYAVEDHLTHRVIDTAYEPSGEPGQAALWDARRARRWLTFLACQLHDHRERDLAWWQLSGRVLPVWLGPVLGFGGGLVCVAAVLAWDQLDGGLGDATTAVYNALSFGIAFALVSSVVWYVTAGHPPGRLSWSLHGSAQRLQSGFWRGAALCAWTVGPVAVVVTLIRVVSYTAGFGSLQSTEEFTKLLTICLALCVVTGLALAAHSWLNAPPSSAAQVSPVGSAVQDRVSSLAGALVAGLVFGGLAAFGLRAGLVTGGLVFRWATGWPGWPGHGDAGAFLGHDWRRTGHAFGVAHQGPGWLMVLPGAVFGYFILLSRAWPRFVLARVWLAARGKLPWRLFAFLADARRREILRQSGGAYQFRHIRLQEALAARPAHAEARPDTAPRGVVGRRVLLVTGAAVLVGGGAVALTRTRDTSRLLFSAPDAARMRAVAFRPGTGELVWGDARGRVWTGDRIGGAARLALPRPARLAVDRDGRVLPAGVDTLAFDPGGELLVVAAGGHLLLRRAGRWLPSDTRTSPVRELAVGAGGRLLAGVPARVTDLGVWRAAADGTLRSVREPDGAETAPQVTRPVFTPDGALWALSQEVVVRYDPPRYVGADAVVTAAHTGDATADVLAVAPHEALLYVASGDRGGLWRPTGGHWSLVDRLPGATAAAHHPTRPVLALGRSRLADYEERADGTVELWSTGPGPRRIRELQGHLGGVACLAFDSEGRHLASAGTDGTVRIWDVTSLL
ncbi:hypothetical protein [Streptomyces sp. VRA16 Mangrove soil]|uniref:NACHT and WD40 repeat domain-containing protein n=1 Tax=Streptomyces sp. VRA16 Mangrove soil TaxID=2817434 RepID=UPI001A9D05B3|nr:hypothetical protein [Streptomyces sp. VRA16 Mangrove soil]MBO1335070.1 hypothetical protein [Streptomyces sp. VRA16 Mangrove soil]